MNKIGIITYHAAYNYGSALQAYATQCAVEKLGYKAEIINYRMPEQKNIYSLYRMRYGIKTLLKDLMQFPVQKQRTERINKFEDFFKEFLNMSDECTYPDDVYQLWDNYSTIISGSDQIWNKHSLELENVGMEYMQPYLLHGFGGKKISYASSVANMTDDELKLIVADVSKFVALSMREKRSALKMTDLMNRKVDSVVDPTFLLNKADWIDKLNIQKKKNNDKYILYYSLAGIKPLKKDMANLKKIANEKGIRVKVITPFAYVRFNDSTIEMHPEAGPRKFLELIYNAEMIVTNSYHGTILSLNLGKNVYSICENGGSEFRKTEILERLGLKNRIVSGTNELLTNIFTDIDYAIVDKKLSALRAESYQYLEQSLIENKV
ncbi:MAG: polysaccharide pyruvyl transferase family protein [Eubacteriales bacterium]|nr:polysaccharide pyruvyl transferase family protein [Eubacteriales bacterium]